MRRTKPAEDRFFSKVRPTTGCWEWSGRLDSHGYGRLKVGGKMVKAHRLAFELLKGPIPPGHEIDHLCRNRGCVNPDHMEAVTPRVNLMRGRSLQALNAVKQFCNSGHPFDEANTRFYRGTRHCRTCQVRWSAKSHARRSVA